jgi:hypothetical protein
LSNDKDVIIREWQTFLSSEGCIAIHGAGCFKACREQYDRHVQNISVLREIRRLASLESEIGDTSALKEMLIKHFPTFRENFQHDSGDAFLSMLECMPTLEEKFNLGIRASRTCLKCENTKVWDELNGLMNLNYLNYDLQEAVGEFCTRRGEVLIKCSCTTEM